MCWGTLNVWGHATLIYIGNITLCSVLSVQKWVVMAGYFPSATVVFKCVMGENRHWRGICRKPSSLLIFNAPLFLPGFSAIMCRSFPCRTGFFGMPYLPCHYTITSTDFCFTPAWYLNYIYSTSVSLSSLPPSPPDFLTIILYIWESFLTLASSVLEMLWFWYGHVILWSISSGKSHWMLANIWPFNSRLNKDN